MSGGAGGWRWFVPVALVGIGLLFVTTARLSSGDDVRSQRNGDLTGLIEAEQTRLGDLTDRVQSLRDQVDQLSAPADDRGLRQLQRASGRANAAAGITATSGPALEVTLTDAAVPADGIPDGFVPDDYVVHQQDLQGVINALWAGGAEALQVQDNGSSPPARSAAWGTR